MSTGSVLIEIRALRRGSGLRCGNGPRLDDTSLTISSPGGFSGGITTFNYLHETHARSPLLTDAFRRTGLVERSGRGIARTITETVRLGRHAPDFSRSNPDRVVASLGLRRSDLELVTLITERESATGDPLGLWAAKTSDMLLALQDNACERAAGRAISIDHCRSDTPGHLHGYSVNRPAADESETVRNSDKFARARLLPVPRHVDVRGHTFMGAHFKIAQPGLVSPRMHYLDSVHRDGRIYIGYIGPHLPTSRTN